MMSVYNIHENLIEVLLEMQSYPDVQAVLAKYDGKQPDSESCHQTERVQEHFTLFKTSICPSQRPSATRLRCSKRGP